MLKTYLSWGFWRFFLNAKNYYLPHNLKLYICRGGFWCDSTSTTHRKMLEIHLSWQFWGFSNESGSVTEWAKHLSWVFWCCFASWRLSPDGVVKFAKPQDRPRRPHCDFLVKYSLANNMLKPSTRAPALPFGPHASHAAHASRC